MKAFCQSSLQWQPISLSRTVRDKEYCSAIAYLAISCPGENRILHFFHKSIDRTWARACNMHSPGRGVFHCLERTFMARTKEHNERGERLKVRFRRIADLCESSLQCLRVESAGHYLFWHSTADVQQTCLNRFQLLSYRPPADLHCPISAGAQISPPQSRIAKLSLIAQ